jgi:hypothetical protein
MMFSTPTDLPNDSVKADGHGVIFRHCNSAGTAGGLGICVESPQKLEVNYTPTLLLGCPPIGGAYLIPARLGSSLPRQIRGLLAKK